MPDGSKRKRRFATEARRKAYAERRAVRFRRRYGIG